MEMFEPQYASMKDPFKEESKKLDQDATWGDTVRRYRSEKIHRPVEVMVPRVDRVTVYDKSREQRQFDPILQKYREESKEGTLRSTEGNKLLTHMNKAKDQQNRQETSYNVINHKDKREGIMKPEEGAWQELWNGAKWNAKCIKASMNASDYKSDTRANFNIITGLMHDTHHWAPPNKRPVIVEKEKPPRKISVVCGRRDYNILTGRYIEDHEDKTAIDKRVAKQDAVEKYWRTHDYDPIRVMFHDADKEAEYQRMRRDMAMGQEKNMVKNLPETYRNAKGNIYNITTLLVKDPERMEELEEADEEEFRRLREGGKQVMEKQQKENMFEKMDRDNRRQYNRINHKRYEDFHANKEGYHLVTNKGYQGRVCEHPEPARTKRAPNLWEKCQHSAPPDEFDSSAGNLNLDDPKEYMFQPYAKHPTPRHPLEPTLGLDSTGATGFGAGGGLGGTINSQRSVRTGFSGGSSAASHRSAPQARTRKAPDAVPSLDLTQSSGGGVFGQIKITPTLVDVQPSGASKSGASRASSYRTAASGGYTPSNH